jgi:transportin-1
MALLMGCCQDESPDVRQSAFGVLGELSAHTVGLVQAVLPQLAPIVHQQMLLLDERNYSTTSNAAWLLSNVVSHQVEAGGNLLTAASGLDTLALDTVNALRSNEHYTGDATNMCENMCVALGDMLLYDTELCGRLAAQGAPMGSYLKPWCEYTRNMGACAGKDRAIEGMLLALQRDPGAAVACLDRLFDVAISLPPSLPLEQRNLLGAVFGAIKAGMGAGWATAMAAYKAESRQVLYQKFAIA